MDKRAPVPAKEYQDFEIAIGRCADQAYPVRVRSPKGEGQGQLIVPYTDNELKRRLGLIELSLLYSLRKVRRAVSAEEKPVQEFGQVLFDALFSGEVRELYYSSQRDLEPNRGLRMRLVIQDPWLAALPWEFLYDPREQSYICLSASTPLVRCIDLPRPARPLEVEFPLRVLGLVAGPGDLESLDAEAEKRNINTALKTLTVNHRVEIEWLEGSTSRDLQEAMWRGPWHIFHFIGHGGYHTERDEGYICLTGKDGLRKNLYASELKMLLHDHSSLRLVVLNACSSARSTGGDMFSSTASTLMNAGIPAVLAMQYAISDDAALELARAFYAAVVSGIPVESAVAEARKAIRLSGDSLEWAVPVLYSRATEGVLFHCKPQELPAVEKPKTPSARGARADKSAGEGKPKKRKPDPTMAAPELTQAKTAPQGAEIFPPLEPETQPINTSQPANEEGTVWLDVLVPETELAQKPASASVAKKQIPRIENVGANRDLRLVLNRDVCLDLVYVPAGEFIMGANNSGEDVKPAHSVKMYGYWISRYPVTYIQFRDYWSANPERQKGPEFQPAYDAPFPVVGIPYASALGFCNYLNLMFKTVLSEGVGFALPTEAEWEKAARGTDQRLYPWGTWDNPAWANVKESNINRIRRVDAYPPEAQSPYGCADLCGNVWEMTRSIYSRPMPLKLFSLNYIYPFQHIDGRNDSRKRDVLRVARGGSYRSSIKKCTVVERASFEENETRSDLGFRIALTPLNAAGSTIAPAKQLDQLEILLTLLDGK